MAYKNIICVLLVTCTVSFSLFSQDNKHSNDSINYTALNKELKGTYQIQMIDTRSLPSFPLEMLITIEEKREDNNVVYHNVSDIMRIKILPKSVINAENFEPIERIIHISSKDI